MENGKQSEWKAGQNAKDGEKNYFALETVFVRIYNVLVTATANAELMKDRCPSESDCQGVAAGRALSVRTNVLGTAIAEAKPKAELTILKRKG